MTDATTQARDDLAYMRSVVAEGRPFAQSFGFFYAWSGTIYAAQCLFFVIALLTNTNLPGPVWLAASILPTLIFVGMLMVWFVKNRQQPKPKGPVARAIDAAFNGTGLANLAMITVFGYTALHRNDYTFWLFYAAAVCAIQGAVWYSAARLRRRMWMYAVAFGWLVSAVASGLLVDNILAYLSVLTFALIALMAVPGFALMRSENRV
jgi:hypothetical protein